MLTRTKVSCALATSAALVMFLLRRPFSLSSRSRLAVVDDSAQLHVYDVNSKQCLLHENNVNGVAWNTGLPTLCPLPRSPIRPYAVSPVSGSPHWLPLHSHTRGL